MMEKAMKACFQGRQRVPWWSLEERLNFEYSLKKKEVDALRENKKSFNWNQFEDTAKIKLCFVAFMASYIMVSYYYNTWNRILNQLFTISVLTKNMFASLI